MMLVLLMGFAAADAASRFDTTLIPFEVDGEFDYVVQPGDSLGGIVMQQYPDQRGNWQNMMRAVFLANRDRFVGTEHRLPVGTRLALPATAPTEILETVETAPEPPPLAPLYTAGSVVSMNGDLAEALRTDRATRSLSTGSAVHVADTIVTGADSQAVIRLVDGRLLVVRQSSELTIDTLNIDQRGNISSSLLTLARGGLRWISQVIERDTNDSAADAANTADDDAGYQLQTPMAVIGIRGTDFAAQLCLPPRCERPSADQGTVVGLLDGSVGLSNDAAANVELDPGDVYLVSDPTVAPVSRPDLAAFVFGDIPQGTETRQCLGPPGKWQHRRCQTRYRLPGTGSLF